MTVHILRTAGKWSAVTLFTLLFCGVALLQSSAPAFAEDQWVTYPGRDEGVGKNCRVVLVSGDEEYRSEEALPALGRMLSEHHGFHCTVLFAVDPKNGEINPVVTDNIPGLQALEQADLLVIFTRFRNLPPEQMKYLADYIESGKPIIGLRTATHAFNISDGKHPYAKYSWGNQTWDGGFGRQVLGETWVNHHGNHGSQSTLGLLVPEQASHPILTGLKDGDIWGPTDVYGVNLPLPGDSLPLVMGQVLSGMQPDTAPVAGDQNSPMMPIAWTRSYTGTAGQTARVFTTTMGASQDMASAGLRRLLLNACLWCTGREEQIQPDLNVELAAPLDPSPFSFAGHRKGIKPAMLAAE